ncbi:MAG TPA: protein kinase, partial [Polyangiaceae bacterium]|nr:protein kinase [Polyangiaceae bacterium]
PHNVLMTRFGEVKLVDFGLAKASSHLTADEEDIVKGKFGYLAPEVTLGQGADRRVDIFAAGILLWEMLAGRRLFKGETDLLTFQQVQAAVVPDMRQIRGDVGDDLAYVLSRALARDREQRYPQAGDFAKDLAIVLDRLGKPVTYQDIAKLVVATAGERTKKRKSEPRDAAGMMGDLILDALHDFSGNAADLAPVSLGTRGLSGAAPTDFVDPSAWGLDALFDDAPSPAAPPPRPAAPPVPPGAHSPAPAPRPPAPSTSGVAPVPAAQRARPAEVSRAPADAGPFWRRWFGG